MGKRVVDDASLKAVADRIRGWTGLPEELEFPAGFVSGVDAAVSEGSIPAYNQGYMDGYDDGYSVGHLNGKIEGYDEGKADGITEGKQAEYDRFWDSYQQNGNRDDYTHGFAGKGWNRNNFLPKYDLVPFTVNTCFHSLNRDDADWESFDMVEHLASLGVVLDTSNCTNFSSIFMWAWVGRIGVIDCTGTTNHTLSSAFGYGKIKTIDKLIVKPENMFTSTFQNQTELVNITFEGTIGNAISFQWSIKLSKASIESVIGHLSTTTSGLSATFSKTAVNKAFETSEGANDGSTSPAWVALVSSRPNWTINLV